MTTKRVRMLKIPLPEPRTGNPEIDRYLLELKRSLEENLRDLYITTGERKDTVDTLAEGRFSADFPQLNSFEFSYNAGTKVISWNAGSIYYKGTEYEIASSSSDANDTWLWWTTAGGLQHATSAPAFGTGTWIVGLVDDDNQFQLVKTHWLLWGGVIQADSITANQIAAGTITATELAANYIIVTGAAADVNANATEVESSKVLIHDSTTLTQWRHSSDYTKIKGGEIYTGSVTANQIAANTITANEVASSTITVSECAFTPVEAEGAAADVNAYTTKIGPGKILISGATTLSDWQSGADATKIDGGNIYTDTVTATQISVTNLASINSDLGAITAGTLSADRITAGTISTDRLSVGDLDLISTTDIGDNITAGYIGSATDHFDINNSEILLSNVAGTDYVKLTDGKFELHNVSQSPQYTIETGGTFEELTLGAFANTTSGFDVELRKARGTIASPANTQDDDILGRLKFGYRSGASWSNAGFITAQFDTVANGCHFVFNGSGSGSNFVTFFATGDVLCSGGRIATNSADYWDLNDYTAGTVTDTGYVTVTINGTAYKLLARLEP